MKKYVCEFIGTALKQVWVFIVAPFVGSVLAAFTFRFLNKKEA